MFANGVGRRQSERRTCSIRAQAKFYDGTPPVECIITDFSAAGARLQAPADCEFPGAFDLHVPSRGDTRHALLRWRTPDAIGVEFIQARGTTGDQRLTELLMRVNRVEDELRAVRASVALTQAATQAAGTASPIVLPGEPPDAARVGALEVRMRELEERASEGAALSARVATLEARNGEILVALKQTLLMLAGLRDTPIMIAKAG